MGEKETMNTGGRQEGAGGGIAIDEEGVQRRAGAAGYVQDNSPNAETERRKDEGSKDAERASNLNLSKSNIDRLAGGGPGPEEATTVKSAKSNSSDRWGDPGADEPEGVAERSNLNSSKSNTYRAAGGDAGTEDAATVKGSKSNTSERSGDPGPGGPEPTDATNLNSSRSN